MGLMQLLSVGRSLSEARDRPNRYKLRMDGMPRLNQAVSVVERSGVEQMSVAELKTQTVETPKRMNVETTVEPKAPVKQAFPLGRWTLKANPFKSSYKPAPRSVVQGELSLDKVKPVRNDLSDSDLELIARKPTRHVEPGQNVFAAPKAGQAKKAPLLARIRERLFRAKAK